MKITSLSFLKTENGIKLAAGVSMPAHCVCLRVGENTYEDAFNLAEPYDRKTHVFYLPENVWRPGEKATLGYSPFKRLKIRRRKTFAMPAPEFADEEALLAEYDHGVHVINEEKETLFEGLTYTKFTCADNEDKPVIISLLETDLQKTALYIGTPGDGETAKGVKATIPDMAAAAEAAGKNVLAGVNADFFDMFGDNHPSGLCVKNGKIISNVRPERPYIGLLDDGTAVIASQQEAPELTPRLMQAAAGMQMIVKDGKLFDWAPLEPFSYVRHPRTAAGVTEDGKVLLLEVDGRIPAHSNGMSLVDLGLFMIKLGAVCAVNLDGGGSSAVYTKTDGAFTLRTRPADLIRPNSMLIRKDFNAIFIVEK